MTMQKGMMITVIVDGVIQLTSLFETIAKRIKEEKVITDKEAAYINSVFTERLKEGNQYIEKVKELISPKLAMSEEDKLKQFERMYTVMKWYAADTKKFEKGFNRLCEERKQMLADVQEVARLFGKEKSGV